MSSVAILEYVVAPASTHVLLVKDGFTEPLIFEARDEEGGILERLLELCAMRLLIDFHGLPADWDVKPDPRISDALALPPAVPAFKRNKAVLERNIASPNFRYGADYWTNLGSRLLPAALRPHLEGCEHLAIVPHGPLHALSFAALRWDANEYLIERFGLSHAPSLSVLRSCRARNPRREADTPTTLQGVLTAAVAAADDDTPAFFEDDAERLAAICRAFSPDMPIAQLAGVKAASKAEILRQASGHELIHLACHGVFGGDQHIDALDSGLLVSNGEQALGLSAASAMPPSERHPWILSARDLFALRLRANLVTLRACSSGRSALRPGDELLGLTRAVLYAGAASLIVSLWNVHQKSSQMLLSAFYENWLKPGAEIVPKWKALQTAQVSLLKDGYPHPFHWAPFILLGDWM